MLILLMTIISVLLSSCKGKEENINKTAINGNSSELEITKDSNNKFKVVKIDSIANLYLIYASKEEKYYKIVSKKTHSSNLNCNRISTSSLYDFKLDTLYSYKEFFGQHVDGVEIDGITVHFETDSIMELYGSTSIKGLCYKE